MSRLSAAIDRAGSVPTVTDVDAVSQAAEVPPRTWTFDDDVLAAAPAERPVDTPCAFAADVAGKLVIGDADPVVVEQHRRLGALIHRAQVERGVVRVMVASAVAAEGKTLTATNIALTLSHSYRRRVLLIDADLRRPSLHTLFGLAATTGLIDCLRATAGRRLPVTQVSSTLWLLPGGYAEADPMGALVSDAMKQLLFDAGEQFDCVVIDTPPVALMPDAHLLAGMIDAAILIIAAGSTPYPLVQRAIAAIGPARILGAVLNRAPHAVAVGGYGSYYASYPTGARVPSPALGGGARE